MTEIVIPYAPRNWAKPFHASYKRFAALVLHRRAGKTTAILNHHVRAALDNAWETARLRYLLPKSTDAEIRALLKRRTYWHIMPTFRQGKLTGAWDILQESARRIPGVKLNQQEMSAVFPNGNKVQIIGADNPDALRGPALSGASLDEYSQIQSRAFTEVVSKALADHVGYAIFSGTIQGMDQLYRTYEAAKDDREWFALWRNVDDSLATETGGTLTAIRRAMEDDRALVKQGLMTQAEYDQEWFLSPEAAIKGAFFGAELQAARDQGRITQVPYDPALPVDTDWDLGIDAMAVWFTQTERSGTVRVVDYLEDVGSGMIEVIKQVTAKPYVWGRHWGPHDIQQREISSGTTRQKLAAQHGFHFQVTPRVSVEDGITAAQLLLARCYFDEERCKHGLEALRHYRRTYNQRLDQYTSTPVHDWSSHAADAFRGLAVRHQVPRRRRPMQPATVGGWRSW